MSKKILLDAFYTQFSDFLGELSNVFPSDTDFPTYQTQLHLIKKVNPTLLIKEAGAYLCPVEHLLRARDADAFLKSNIPAELEQATDNVSAMVQKLRGYWRTMTPQNQAVVWAYLLLLTEIAKRHNS
jgi:hypothetical protein